jgi:hypothetical protein
VDTREAQDARPLRSGSDERSTNNLNGNRDFFNVDSAKSNRVLRILLWLLALDAALGTIVQLFAGRSLMMRLFPYAPATEVTDLLLLRQRQFGAIGVALTVMLVAAARDPRGNVLVVRALTLGVTVAGVVELAGIWTLQSGRLYPITLTVAHALTRFAVAGLLMFLSRRAQVSSGEGSRPREVAV